MPLYEYVCCSCQIRFERLVKRFGEEVSCPACEGAVDRQPSVFAVASSQAAPLPACGAGGCETARCQDGPCGGGACRLPS